MTDESNKAIAARDRMLFVKATADAPWTEAELENMVESIDSVTPDDVGVLVSTDEIEYMNRDEVEQYVEQLVDALEG